MLLGRETVTLPSDPSIPIAIGLRLDHILRFLGTIGEEGSSREPARSKLRDGNQRTCLYRFCIYSFQCCLPPMLMPKKKNAFFS